MSKEKKLESSDTITPPTPAEEEGNALVPLYWFLGGIMVIIALVLLGAD
jgi:hypothetical protein